MCWRQARTDQVTLEALCFVWRLEPLINKWRAVPQSQCPPCGGVGTGHICSIGPPSTSEVPRSVFCTFSGCAQWGGVGDVGGRGACFEALTVGASTRISQVLDLRDGEKVLVLHHS